MNKLAPAFHSKAKSTKHRFGHREINEKVDLIENIYADSNITINPTSQLSTLLKSARQYAQDISCGNSSTYDSLFKALHVERISDALYFLQDDACKGKYLKDLLHGGTLDFFDRKPSHAKSILWELEVWTKIKKSIPDTHLEEPDIMVDFGSAKIAVPCKKLFSESGVSKVLSNAVSQIKNTSEFGIVALNIDDLSPESSINREPRSEDESEKCGAVLKGRTYAQISDFLHRINMGFLRKHERHFLKYLSASRIIAVIASTSVVTDVLLESPKFSNFSESSIWTIPDLKPSHRQQIEKFREIIFG